MPILRIAERFICATESKEREKESHGSAMDMYGCSMPYHSRDTHNKIRIRRRYGYVHSLRRICMYVYVATCAPQTRRERIRLLMLLRLLLGLLFGF